MTDYNLIGNKIVEAKQHPLGYSAMELFEPERFNPLCSLDTIERQIEMILSDAPLSDRMGELGENINSIYTEVHALRAYITGIEKSNES